MTNQDKKEKTLKNFKSLHIFDKAAAIIYD